MESRAFIRQAGVLSNKIQKQQLEVGTQADREQAKVDIQKELNQLFSGLQNPTLPSASKLKDLAASAGYSVPPRAASLIQQAESYWD